MPLIDCLDSGCLGCRYVCHHASCEIRLISRAPFFASAIGGLHAIETARLRLQGQTTSLISRILGQHPSIWCLLSCLPLLNIVLVGLQHCLWSSHYHLAMLLSQYLDLALILALPAHLALLHSALLSWTELINRCDREVALIICIRWEVSGLIDMSKGILNWSLQIAR